MAAAKTFGAGEITAIIFESAWSANLQRENCTVQKANLTSIAMVCIKVQGSAVSFLSANNSEQLSASVGHALEKGLETPQQHNSLA
jgi:hypothetical protein